MLPPLTTTPPGSPGSELQHPSPCNRRVTRRAYRALTEAQAKYQQNSENFFAALPDELVLRVAALLIVQPKPEQPAAEEAAAEGAAARAQEPGTSSSPARDLLALLCTSRRFYALRGAVTQHLREETGKHWEGSPLVQLPTGASSWLHLMYLIEQQAIAVSFRWKIENWSAFQREAAQRTYSSSFSAGGFSWRLLLFPRGNTVPYVSLYLAVTSDFRQRLPSRWTKFARFALIVPNATGPALVKVTQHQFDAREDDWGFTQLLELTELSDAPKGWLVDDALTLEALLLPFSEQPVRHYVTLSWGGEEATDLRGREEMAALPPPPRPPPLPPAPRPPRLAPSADAIAAVAAAHARRQRWESVQRRRARRQMVGRAVRGLLLLACCDRCCCCLSGRRLRGGRTPACMGSCGAPRSIIP